MPYSIQEMNRPVRRRLKRVVHNEKDANYCRRANAMLLLHEGYCKSAEAGLVPERPGAPETTVNEALCAKLLALIEQLPSVYGFHRSRWSSEMLALQLEEDLSVVIHASTIRRLLPKLNIVWNRARPTLHQRSAKNQENAGYSSRLEPG